MKSELSFLLELILDEETTKIMKAKLVKRVQEVEKNYTTQPQQNIPRGTRAAVSSNPVVAAQSPSMQRLMAENPDLVPKPAQPVTSAAAQALAQRQASIGISISGKEEKGRTSPRKF